MRTVFHLLCFSLYAGLAGAVAFVVPAELPGPAAALGAEWLPVLAVAVLLGGGLIHEVAARLARDAARDRELDSLDYAYELQSEELTWLRREVETLRGAQAHRLNDEGGPGSGGRGVEEIMKEVKVLKSLVPRLGGPLPLGGRGPEAAPDRAPDRAPDGAPGAAETWTEPGPGGATARSDLGGAIAGPLPSGFMPPLAEALPEETVLDIVRSALREDRVDLVLQPIVSLPQRRRRFYECFSRLRTPGGEMILPEQYIALAERAGLVQAIDNMLLFRCVQLVRKLHRRSDSVEFFCNISPHSLADQAFFADFVDFLESNAELASHLVFEFAQADFARWSEAGAGLLDRLSHLGCRFSLDQVVDLELDTAALARRHVRFLKIEADRLMHEVADKRQLLRGLRRRSIDLIVEKVEDEGLLVELLDYDIDFGQGFLFGAPRLARPAA